MSEIGRFLIELLQTLWPFERVMQWERGEWYVWGRHWRSVGPGIYPLIPWVMRIVTCVATERPERTPLLQITLRDGTPLAFSVTALVQVVDAAAAFNRTDLHRQSTVEVIAGVTAARLADVDASRLAPEHRRRLVADLRRWINEETLKFGVACRDVWFTNFCVGIRAYRLLTESATAYPLTESAS